MAVVESQLIAISYQKPVIIEAMYVVPGQEVRVGDTLLRVSRPDLSLEIDKKRNELERSKSEKLQSEQNYRSKLALSRLEAEGKLNRLQMELTEINTRISQQHSINQKLRGGEGNGGNYSFSDSLMMMKKASIEQEYLDVKNYLDKELDRLRLKFHDEQSLIDKIITINMRELTALEEEYSSLIQIAKINGIVGVVNVQLHELVPPYKSVVSIFETRPSLIKAYMNEAISYPVSVGDSVKVVSENRLYSIEGVVLELGARITDLPDKIQPVTTTRSYGQEVFIRIPANNQFLNGEKVFVHPKDAE